MVLARAGVKRIGLADDDEIERTNLHRQILFDDAEVGKKKVEVAARKLDAEIVQHPTRLLPDNAIDLVSRYDLVLEGSDNFATKFLTADACAIARVPVVHASAVRWVGTALAVTPSSACYRCLFEDVPREDAPNCAEAGVMGPVVGVVGALAADLALGLLDGHDLGGHLVAFDRGVRRRVIRRRKGCPLCGESIRSIDAGRYVSEAC
jgi:adenylyltransferase/sulfurtransferase